MSNLAVHFSAKKPDWQTPDWVLERLGPIALDPCTEWDNPTKAKRYCVAPEFVPLTLDGRVDGLAWDWVELAGEGLIYCNPPYGRQIGQWLEKGKDCRDVV